MKSNKIIHECLRYIEENLQETLTVEQIAGNVGYSEFYFSRLFKENMKVTVMEYVNKRRMEKATEDILQGKKIIDVALQYGWQSHSGFTKAFKKEFGFCPALLRGLIAEIESYGGSVMEHIFLYHTDEHATKEELFEILKSRLKVNGIKANFEILYSMYEVACNFYNGIKRYSGDEYVTHPLNVAILLAELNADYEVICAGMFCDIMKKTNITAKELENSMPENIVVLIKKCAAGDNEFSQQEDEIIMIKLAERLHNMRTIQYMDRECQKLKAKETVERFMPLARKLKNKKLLTELKELSMRYM